MRKAASALIMVAVLGFMAIPLLGAPSLVSYQGVLTDPGGNPVPDDYYEVTFRIYDHPTAGIALWTEVHDSVLVEAGTFHVLLGGTSTMGAPLFDDDERWLGIKVETDDEMTPRARISSVPWSFRALVADSARTAGTSFGTAFTDSSYRYAHTYGGADAGQKIAAAIADLPVAGGTVDARGLEGDQYINQNVFVGLGCSLTLLFGHGTYHISVPQVIAPVNDHYAVRILGQGLGTILKPITDMTVFHASQQWPLYDFKDIRFDLNYSNSTAIHLDAGFRKQLVERVVVENNSPGATMPMLNIENPLTIVRDCEVRGMSRSAHGIEIGAEGVSIDNVHVGGCYAAVYVRTGFPAMITNSLLSGNYHALLAGSVYETTFENNNCEHNDWGHIKIVGNAAQFPIVNTVIKGNHLTGIGSPGNFGIYIENARGVIIQGNVFNAYFPGQPIYGVIFGDNVSEVTMIGNVANNIELSMPGSEDVPLAVDDIQATQSSGQGGFGGEVSFGGPVNVGEGLRLAPADAPPTSPKEGDVYMDSVTHKLMVYDGTTWRPCW